MALINKTVKFERLISLGPERLTAVNNALSSGSSALQVARMIQMEWGEIKDIAEESLAKQLIRYKEQTLGNFQQVGTSIVGLDPIALGKLDALAELDDVIRAQKTRVLLFIAEERKGKKADKDVSAEIRLLNELIHSKLKAEFDVGQRTFMGPLPMLAGKPGQMMPTMTATVMPNGGVQLQVKDAVDSATAIMQKYATEKVIEAEK
jgi:hypothetical protein